MRTEWDEAKRELNLEKRGLDFADAEGVLEGDLLGYEDFREDYGEPRLVVFGLLAGSVV